MAANPPRYGIRQSLLARDQAAGWGTDGHLTDAAERLVAGVAAGPDPGGARTRLAAILEADPEMAADLLSDAALGDAAVAIAGASRALAAMLP